jgi:hypothetical protein
VCHAGASDETFVPGVEGQAQTTVDYGSGGVWSAQLAAMMLSVLQTVLLWGLNPHHWLSAFLQACADHGGKSPTDLSPFLPWAMTPAYQGPISGVRS